MSLSKQVDKILLNVPNFISRDQATTQLLQAFRECLPERKKPILEYESDTFMQTTMSKHDRGHNTCLDTIEANIKGG